MKKTLSAILGALMVLTVVAAPMASYADFGRSYNAPKATPTIDGTAEAIWDSAEWTQVDKPYDGSDAADYPGAALRVKILWDEKNCYFLAEVTDSDVNYDNDIVEIYFDENNGKEGAYEDDDSQTRFYKDGAVVAGSGTNCKEDSLAVGVDTATGWIIEGSLPWTLSHKEGDTIGFEMMYNIGDSEADFAQAFRWNVDTGNGDPAPYADNSSFGVLTLDHAPAVSVATGYDSAEAAAAAAGKSLITGYTFVEGSEVNFGEEYAENLWDADVETKYCTAEDCNGEEGFPAWSTAKLPAAYDITGFTMATANDNESYNGRSPLVWNLYVSSDGSNWTTLASGDDTFFDEVNYTYFIGDASASNVSYVKFECLETDSGTMQVSEVNLFGDIHVEAEAAPAPAAEAAPAAAPAAEAAPAAAPAAEAAPAAAPVAAAAPADPAAAAQTGDVTAIAVLAAVAALGTAVVIGKRK